jgi:hypothetical protein
VSEGWCPLVDVIRTDFRQDVLTLYSLFPPQLKEWLEKVVLEGEALARRLVIASQ